MHVAETNDADELSVTVDPTEAIGGFGMTYRVKV